MTAPISPRALVRGPLYEAMSTGSLCRFEEVTRDFEVAGVTFDGGEGVLARATAESVRAAQADGSHDSSRS